MKAISQAPTTVAIEADEDFQFYKSGILNSKSCGSSDLDHAVLAVGYMDDGINKYYIIKNSWGTDWGE